MELEEKIDPKHTAVLVIDMQHDFCSSGGAYDKANPGLDLEPVKEIVPRLARFLDDARAADVQVIYVQAIYNTADNRYLSPVWLEHAARRRNGLYTSIPLCEEGSWGAEIIPELAPHEGDVLITKHRYSAFIDTSLQQLLRNTGIQTILITGVGTSGCVESTARDGFMLDHYTITVGDCVSTYWRDAHEASLTKLELLFGQVIDSQDLVAAWQRVPALHQGGE